MSCIILVPSVQEMAENASTIFNVYLPEFVDAIWVALRDPTLAVHEKAVEALRACLYIAPRRGKSSPEALACVGSFASAMGPEMEPYVRSLLESMFSSGLSPTLVEALERMTSRTLAQFDFKGHDLLEFAKQSVLAYLEDEDGATRKDAAICCCRLVEKSLYNMMVGSQSSSGRATRAGSVKRRRLIEEEEERKKNTLVDDLTLRIDEKNKALQSSREQLMEVTYSLNQLKYALGRKDRA
ncbi:Serine/threonine-protein kinase [Nymphaea thermarum]|nr:Serine/threonine-protein kinase [Nymphaea thermarum]